MSAKEELLKKFDACVLINDIFDGLKQTFEEKFFNKANKAVEIKLDEFNQKNKHNKLMGYMISKQGELSALSTFVVDHELILSDEIIRQLKKKFEKIYMQLFYVVTELIKEERHE